MIVARHFDGRWRECVRQSLAYLYEHLVRRPWHGLKDIVHGLALAVPVLCEALRETITSHLSPADLAQLREGLEQLWEGWLQIRWLLVALVLVRQLGWCGLLLFIAGTVFVASI